MQKKPNILCSKCVFAMFFLLTGILQVSKANATLDSLLIALLHCPDSLKYKTCTLIADEYYYDNKLPESAEYYLKAAGLELMKEKPSPVRLSESYGNVGYCYREMGKYGKAMEWYKLALKLAIESNDSSEIAALNINIGNTQLLLGNFNQSIEYFKKALVIDKLRQRKENIANSYCNLAKVYDACGKHNEAIGFYKQALEVGRDVNEQSEVIVRLNNIGASFKAMGQADSAKYYFVMAHKLDSALSLNFGNNLPKAKTVNQILKGESYLFTDLVSKVKTTNPRNEIIKLYEEGLQNLHKNNLEKACSLFLKSLQKAEQIGLAQSIIDNSKALAKTYARMDNYKKAYYYHAHYEPLKDSTYNAENIRNLNEFHVLYQTGKKEQEIKLLNQQKEIQELQLKQVQQRSFLLILVAALLIVLTTILYLQYRNKKKMGNLLAEKNKNLDELNATKDRFFAIVAHDLKNPTTAFANITGALNENYDKLEKDEVKYYIGQLNTAAASILNMLKNLLDWAKIQRNTTVLHKQAFNLYQATEGTMNMVAASAKIKKISLTNQVPATMNITSHQASVTTVLCNLIANAVKFSPSGKEVTVGAIEEQGMIKLYVEDQGMGMTGDDIKKLFRADIDAKTIGSSAEKGSGMGLIICKELVDKLGGNIFAESRVNMGTRFIFVLPA